MARTVGQSPSVAEPAAKSLPMTFRAGEQDKNSSNPLMSADPGVAYSPPSRNGISRSPVRLSRQDDAVSQVLADLPSFKKDHGMKHFRNLVMFLLAISLAGGSLNADIKKPVKGKRYTLAKNHGPWMLMVASIRDVDDASRRIEGGMSAWEVADEIVFALREKNIPAYVYALEEKMGEVSSPRVDAGGRKYVAQRGYVSVLAGNFETSSDGKIEQLRDFIKNKFNPPFLTDPKNGGILRKTPGRPSPFTTFLTVNPLWEGEVRDVEQDNFIAELNDDQKYSLLDNKGKYTLVVATFHGTSVLQVGNNSATQAMGFFEKHFGTSLDGCAENAMQFTDKLRNAKKYGYDTNYEAWVFHDKYKSVVTMGSFDSKDDPRIRTMATQFGGKLARNPNTGDDVMTGEQFTVPRVPKRNQLPTFSWVFDAEPRLMLVPKVN